MNIQKLELFIGQLKVKSTSNRAVIHRAQKISVNPRAIPVYVMDHSSSSPRSIEQLYYGDTWRDSVPFMKPNRKKLSSVLPQVEF